jgi:hypothetical protein
MSETKSDDSANFLFVETNAFRTAWAGYGLTDADLFEVQSEIAKNPSKAPIIAGTGGVRKMRFSPSSLAAGKSGAYRVIYAHFGGHAVVLLVTAYAKNEMANISPQGKKAIRKLMKETEQALSGNQSRGKQ